MQPGALLETKRGKEQPQRRLDETETGNNVNPKMRFKANFPTCCSHAADHNLRDFEIAKKLPVTGSGFSLWERAKGAKKPVFRQSQPGMNRT